MVPNFIICAVLLLLSQKRSLVETHVEISSRSINKPGYYLADNVRPKEHGAAIQNRVGRSYLFPRKTTKDLIKVPRNTSVTPDESAPLNSGVIAATSTHQCDGISNREWNRTLSVCGNSEGVIKQSEAEGEGPLQKHQQNVAKSSDFVLRHRGGTPHNSLTYGLSVVEPGSVTKYYDTSSPSAKRGDSPRSAIKKVRWRSWLPVKTPLKKNVVKYRKSLNTTSPFMVESSFHTRGDVTRLGSDDINRDLLRITLRNVTADVLWYNKTNGLELFANDIDGASLEEIGTRSPNGPIQDISHMFSTQRNGSNSDLAEGRTKKLSTPPRIKLSKTLIQQLKRSRPASSQSLTTRPVVDSETESSQKKPSFKKPHGKFDGHNGDTLTASSEHGKRKKKHANKSNKYKENKGHNLDAGYKKKKKGNYGKKHKSGHFDKHGKKYGGADFKVKYHDDDKWKKKGKKGFDFGDKGHHKKGHKTKGFKNVYHKEEYHKKQKFYDDYDRKKHHKKYTNKNKKYLQKKGHKKKGHKAKGKKYGSDFGKKGHFKKGNFHDLQKGHQKKHGHKKKYGRDNHKFGKSSHGWDDGHDHHEHDPHGDHSNTRVQTHGLWSAPQHHFDVIHHQPPNRYPPLLQRPLPLVNQPPVFAPRLIRQQHHPPRYVFNPYATASDHNPSYLQRRKEKSRRAGHDHEESEDQDPRDPRYDRDEYREDPSKMRNSPYDEPDEDYVPPEDLFEEPPNSVDFDPEEMVDPEETRGAFEETVNDHKYERPEDYGEELEYPKPLPSKETAESLRSPILKPLEEGQNRKEEWEEDPEHDPDHGDLDSHGDSADYEDVENDPDFMFADIDDMREPETFQTDEAESQSTETEPGLEERNEEPEDGEAIKPKDLILKNSQGNLEGTAAGELPPARPASYSQPISSDQLPNIVNAGFPSFEDFGNFVGDVFKKSL